MKATRVFLAFSGVIYSLLGLWCSFNHRSVSGQMGYALPNPTAEAEFIVVYGGLEIGIGLFLLLSACQAPLQKAALYFVAILHSSLVLARLSTIVAFSGYDSVIYNLLAVEAFLALVAIVLVVKAKGVVA